MPDDRSKESVKTIEIRSEVIDRLRVGAWKPDNGNGKRYYLFVKILLGNGLAKASGVEFDKEEDALMAQKIVHSVVNEVLA